jgi:pSer/pThr/pTyr-binding forkhead associated (FHA) protein
MAQYQLVVKQGPDVGKVYELSSNEVTLGRDINNNIVINDAEISRNHCRFVLQGDGYVLEDLGSTNGTFVNEQRISGQATLHSGESIRVGENVVLVYEAAGLDADATLASRGARAQMPPPPKQQPPPVPKQQYAGRVPPGPGQAKFKMPDNKTILIGCGVLLVVGICVGVAGLWYIDSKALWCDVFGQTICDGLGKLMGR